MSTYLGDIVSTLTSAMSHTAEPSGPLWRATVKAPGEWSSAGCWALNRDAPTL